MRSTIRFSQAVIQPITHVSPAVDFGLEGHTQWKFQKSHILHWVLDVIAVHMEDTKRCLDYHGTTPVDQTFRCCDSNLHHLKTVALASPTSHNDHRA